jgi:cobalt-zinc-cadmium efflux system membrane fusion protein
MGRVYEQDLSRVAEGLPAEVALIAYPGRTWTGVIDYVSSTLDEDTRSVAIRVVLDNPEGVLRPGMFGTIALGQVEPDGGATAEVISVPETAVSTMGDRTVVFVAGDEPGGFRVRDVVPGANAHGFVEIREGLEPGEAVVNRGAFVLKSEFMKASIGEGHEH